MRLQTGGPGSEMIQTVASWHLPQAAGPRQSAQGSCGYGLYSARSGSSRRESEVEIYGLVLHLDDLDDSK